MTKIFVHVIGEDGRASKRKSFLSMIDAKEYFDTLVCSKFGDLAQIVIVNIIDGEISLTVAPNFTDCLEPLS